MSDPSDPSYRKNEMRTSKNQQVFMWWYHMQKHIAKVRSIIKCKMLSKKLKYWL